MLYASGRGFGMSGPPAGCTGIDCCAIREENPGARYRRKQDALGPGKEGGMRGRRREEKR